MWSRCISGQSSCFLIWLSEHALSVAILVNLLVSTAAIPVSSDLLMVFVIPTPPEFTNFSALVWGQYTTPAPIKFSTLPMQLPSVYAHNFQLGHFNLNCLSSHGWRWTLVFWSLSWPVTSSLFDLKYWGQTNMVGDVVCVLSCRYWFFSQTASGILLCSVCSQFGEASVNAVLLLCSRQQ